MPLRPPPCPKATRTIKKAFDDLSQAISPQDARDFSKVNIADVREAALKIEAQLAAKQQLRNMKRLMPLFSGMEHYAKVMDILCNGTPFLSWVWAPITLILRVSAEHVEAFEKIIKGYAQMAEPLQRFEILGQTFRQNETFQQTLAIFYADMLEFHKHAYVFVTRSGWRLLFLTSWGRFQRRFDGILDDMSRHEALIDKEANARNIVESKKMRDELWSWREETHQAELKTSQEDSVRQLNSIKSWLQADESDQLAIYNSVVTDAEKYPGTCTWLTQDSIIQSFLAKQASPPLVWLQGVLGSGKTVLFSQLITFMSAAAMPVIHHFCSHAFANSLAYDQILQLLILKIVRRDPDLAAYVHENMVTAKKVPTKPVLQKVLLDLLSISSRSPHQTDYLWVLFDGINECHEDQQASLIHLVGLMQKAAKASGLGLKILLASRQTSNMNQLIRKSHVLSLSEKRVQVDQAIREYARCRLLAIASRLEETGITTAVKEDIESCIIEKSDGMFLYAKLVIDHITSNNFDSAPEIMQRVMALPSKLSDFYQKIFFQILGPLDERSIDRLRSLCGWIAFAERPLARHELLSAMSFKCEEPYFTHLASSFALEMAGPLIEQKAEGTFAFIHISLKEYLQTSSTALRINAAEALEEHSKSMIACLLYGMKNLSTGDDHDMSLRVIKGFHGLHLYAMRYWANCLLQYFSQKSPNEYDLQLLQVATVFAEHLDTFSGSTVSQEALSLHPLSHHLADWPCLQMHVMRDVLKRSEDHKGLSGNWDQDVNDETTTAAETTRSDGIQSTLLAYQSTIRTLLNLPHFTGVTSEQFEAFKAQYRTTAFTCRFTSCPYASKGFQSLAECRHHEDTHRVLLRCDAPGCQYPSFSSRKALINHVKLQHRAQPPRRRIRRHQVSSPQSFTAPQPVRASSHRASLHVSFNDASRPSSGENQAPTSDFVAGTEVAQSRFEQQLEDPADSAWWYDGDEPWPEMESPKQVLGSGEDTSFELQEASNGTHVKWNGGRHMVQPEDNGVENIPSPQLLIPYPDSPAFWGQVSPPRSAFHQTPSPSLRQDLPLPAQEAVLSPNNMDAPRPPLSSASDSGESESSNATEAKSKTTFHSTMRSFQSLQEDAAHLKVLSDTVKTRFRSGQLQAVPQPVREYESLRDLMMTAAGLMNGVNSFLLSWYQTARDDNRAQTFFEHRALLLDQFTDGTLKTPKKYLSITSAQVIDMITTFKTMENEMIGSGLDSTR